MVIIYTREKVKVKGHLVHKFEWKWTEGGRVEAIALPGSIMRSVKIDIMCVRV